MVNMNYMYFKRKNDCAIMGTVRKTSSDMVFAGDDEAEKD